MKGAGYLVSSVSVLLLAILSLKSAREDPLLLACLAGGVLLSIVGMCLRYLSHRRDKNEKHRIEGKLEQTRRQVEDGPGYGEPSDGHQNKVVSQ